MSSRGGWPAMVGKVGHSTFTALAERAIEWAPRRKSKGRLPTAVVTLATDGKVWLDMPDDANMREAIMAITTATDPDVLADDIRFEARARGML